jgi:hypothetical protein
MSHWAELDENNIVLQVLVGDNDDPNGDEGYAWLIKNLGGKWVKTSYNATIRKNFAGPGYSFDELRDAFIPEKPFNSWVLDEDSCNWVPPKPYPDQVEDEIYYWNEAIEDWVIKEQEAS